MQEPHTFDDEFYAPQNQLQTIDGLTNVQRKSPNIKRILRRFADVNSTKIDSVVNNNIINKAIRDQMVKDQSK